MLYKLIDRWVMVLAIILFTAGCGEQGAEFFRSPDDALLDKTMQAQVMLDSYYGDRASLELATKLVVEVLEANDQFAPAYVQGARIILKGGHIVNWDFQGGSLEKARKVLERAIQVDPDYPESYVLMGHVDALSGRVDAARENLSTAIRLGSTNPWINNNLGDVEMRSGSFGKADELYEKTVIQGVGETAQQRSAYVSALTQQMNIAYQQSDTVRLVDLASNATKVTASEDAWTWGNSGGLLCRSGKFDLGIEYNRKALTIMSYGVARYNVAYCLYGKWAKIISDGNAVEAQPYFDEAYQLNPDIRSIADDFLNTDIAHLRKVLIQKIEQQQATHTDSI